MRNLLKIETPFVASLSVLLPLPWWWVVPRLLGLLGGTSAGLALAPALRVLTWPFLALTALMLARGWYLELSQGRRWRSFWSRRASVVLATSTLLAVVLWGLRFTCVFGMRPF